MSEAEPIPQKEQEEKAKQAIKRKGNGRSSADAEDDFTLVFVEESKQSPKIVKLNDSDSSSNDY